MDANIKELQDKLIELTLKYLEFEKPNGEQLAVLHKIKEIRKSLETLKPNTHNKTDEYDFRKDYDAFYTYIQDQERKHGISILSVDNVDHDLIQEEWNRYGFSHKTITGKVIVQLVEFYIKNNASTRRKYKR